MNNAKAAIFSLLILSLAICLCLGLLLGPADIALENMPSLFSAYFFNTALLPNTSPAPLWQANILFDIRLPRLLVAALAGSCLALCGAVMQSMFRNPLASPSVLGVSSGASLGAVIALYFGLATVSVWLLPLFAFIGAGLSLFIVYQIACRGGHTAMATLLLAGIAVAALNSTLSSLILALSLDNWALGQSIIYWTMGGLEGRTWDHVVLITPITFIGLFLLLQFNRNLDALLLGETHASSVGVDVAKVRLQLLIITACLVGAAISVCGGIGFIGLVVPHIMRLLLGPKHRYLLAASALGGALMLVAADLLVRTLITQRIIPLGIITASLGAPFFLYLLLRQRGAMKI